MKILLISDYPHHHAKSQSVFVYRLMESLAQMGGEIVVISPQNWRTKIEREKEMPGKKSYGYEYATVYRPKYFDFPNRIRIGKWSLGRLNARTYRGAVKKTLKKIDFIPDVVYAHFLYRSGPGAIMAANYFKVPAVVALGESTLDKHATIYGKKAMMQLIHQFSGIISVSEKNKKYCMEKLQVPKEKIRVFPNAVSQKLFYPRDKKAMRTKYNLPQEKFIVAFTGHFIERKGPLRVNMALEKMKNDQIGGVFIGSGSQEPKGDKVLFKGKLKHHEVPEMLSAADVFVLPTQNEGSCNAIIEAMSCGLPIISSNIEAVKEQVSKKNSILVNPNNVDEIKDAIQVLYDHPDRLKHMRAEAVNAAILLSSEKRAEQIYLFLEQQLSK